MTSTWQGALLGVAPEDIAVSVRVFQGVADALVPTVWGKVLVDRIPGATLTIYPDEGHFIALTRSKEVLMHRADGTGVSGTD